MDEDEDEIIKELKKGLSDLEAYYEGGGHERSLRMTGQLYGTVARELQEKKGLEEYERLRTKLLDAIERRKAMLARS